MDIQKIALTDALEQIAPGASQYIEEDTIGGYHEDEKQRKFPIGAIWGVEGQFLYALVRHFKPSVILEIGTGRGVGSLHIAAAADKNGNEAAFATVDNGTLGYEPFKSESAVYLKAEAVSFLATWEDNSIDFLFEDLDHHAETVRDVAMLALQKLAPGGILVSHDAAHWVVGEAVRKGYAQAGLLPSVFLMPPSDCGVSFWQKPVDESIKPIKSILIADVTREEIEEFRAKFDKPELDYETMTVSELKALLYTRGHENVPARAKKQEYIDLLRG